MSAVTVAAHGQPLPAFRGVNHASLTVANLPESERFYTEVLGFTVVLDFGNGVVCLHKQTGFALALLRHEDATGEPFSHLNTGLDHLGLSASGEEELVAWQRRFEAFGVPHSPIQVEDFGYHLNFRDPNDIALEFQAPSDIYAAALSELRGGNLTDAEVRARAAQLGAGELVAQRP